MHETVCGSDNVESATRVRQRLRLRLRLTDPLKDTQQFTAPQQPRHQNPLSSRTDSKLSPAREPLHHFSLFTPISHRRARAPLRRGGQVGLLQHRRQRRPAHLGDAAGGQQQVGRLVNKGQQGADGAVVSPQGSTRRQRPERRHARDGPRGGRAARSPRRAPRGGQGPAADAPLAAALCAASAYMAAPPAAAASCGQVQAVYKAKRALLLT